MIRVAYGVPAYRRLVDVGHIEQAMAFGATMMAMRDRLSLVGVLTTESCSIDWSRNQLLHQSMKAGADWLLMADADTFHGHYGPKPLQRNPSLDIVRMLEEGATRRAAAIAAPVALRGRPGYNVVVRDDGKERHLTWEEFDGKILEVERIGTAFMCINCHWIKDHWPDQPWFVTQHFPGPEPRKLGEDYSFCEGVRKRGGMILADGRFEPHHIG